MNRVFVGLALPEAVKQRLALMGGGVPGARWVPAENMHVTLRFIGEIDGGRLEDIDLALERVTAPAFEMVLAGAGQFGTGKKARALWVGVDRSEALAHLQAKVEAAVVRAGLAPEERKFSPHVTLARLKEAPPHRVAAFLQQQSLFREPPIVVDHIVLFESLQGRSGVVYEPLREYALDGNLGGL